MDMTSHETAMRTVATYLLTESGRWDVNKEAVADQMNEDARFADLNENQFIEVRDAIVELVQTIADDLTKKADSGEQPAAQGSASG